MTYMELGLEKLRVPCNMQGKFAVVETWYFHITMNTAVANIGYCHCLSLEV